MNRNAVVQWWIQLRESIFKDTQVIALLIGSLLCAHALLADEPVTDSNLNHEASNAQFHDVHFHLTNYIQRGISAEEYFEIVGDRVGRVSMFGIPLQQKWDYFVSGERAPSYYLLSDAALYYYSFVDAMIAKEYLSLSEELQARVDPMITGFNPTDMYAADHIRRVLLAFPGVFSGIGEFSVHKEFVSSKVTGHTASLNNPALDRILEAVAEIGLVAILHCDVDTVRESTHPVHYDDLVDLLVKHPEASVIWAHTGLGRFVEPADKHLELLDEMLSDERLANVALDISWDEVAQYMVRDEASIEAWANLMNKYPTRFLFGTDSVAPTSWDAYVKTFVDYEPLWAALDEVTYEHVNFSNYERIFDAAVPRIREWERKNFAR